MITKIKKLIQQFELKADAIALQNSEIEWAHIYKETIRGKIWLEQLSLSPGRWAANYSLLYVLTRILADYQPKKIIEFGLGESSKLISKFIAHEIPEAEHTIIEHDREWAKIFQSRFSLSNRSTICMMNLVTKQAGKHEYLGYEHIEGTIDSAFDLYLVDGPFGTRNLSRFDIYEICDKVRIGDQFIIVIDDYQRTGEINTAKRLIQNLKSKGLTLFTGKYIGSKTQLVIATDNYRFSTSF